MYDKCATIDFTRRNADAAENGDAAAIRAMWGSGFETKLQRNGSLARPEFDQVNTVGDRNCLKDTDDDRYWLKSGSTASED